MSAHPTMPRLGFGSAALPLKVRVPFFGPIFTVLVVLILTFSTFFSLYWFEIGGKGIELILASKDIILITGIAVVVLWRIAHFQGTLRFSSVDLWLALLLAVNLTSFAISPASLTLRVLNLRRNLELFFLFWTFYYVGRSKLTFKVLIWSSWAAFASVMAFGIFEYLQPNSFWDQVVDIPAYWRNVTLDPFGTSSIADSGRFYTWDLQALVGHPVRRMVSLYLEPTTLAAFILFIFCIGFLRRGMGPKLLPVLLGLLTVSKFYVLAVAISLLIWKFRHRLARRLMLVCYLGCIALAMLALATSLLGITSGAIAHLRGVIDLTQVFGQKKFAGLGLGAAGNYAMSNAADPTLGEESGLGNVTAQIGLGIIVYLAFLNSLYHSLREKWLASQRIEYIVGIMLLISWTVSFFLSASSLGVSGNAFFFIFIGCLLGRDASRKQDNFCPATVSPLHEAL